MEIKKQISRIFRGTAEIIDVKNLEEKLRESQKQKKPLCIKAGFDPTSPDIHLGHVVLLRKLKQLQDIGHQVYFLIGDFTAQIGDPTGCNQARPKLNKNQIEANARTYKEQVGKILDLKKTKIVFNSEWLDELNSRKLLEMTMYSTVAQMLARADFKKRMEEGKEISILEFFYPLLQGYDSVYMRADIEIGGTDQKFNLLMGRQLQEAYGQEPQIVIMTPLLEGTDGIQKMSKSLGNYIGISEPPAEIFGKIMSINDSLMYKYFEFLTDFDLKEVNSMHPKEAKLMLAQDIVSQFCGIEEAKKARKNFEMIFSKGKSPDNIFEYKIKNAESGLLADILLETKLVCSKNEFRRLLKQGAISCNGEKIANEDWKLKEGVIKIGKMRFLKLN